MLHQVLVHEYKDAENFVVELKTKGGGDRLILAKLSPGKSLWQTSDTVLKKLRANAPESGWNDRVIVPYVTLNLEEEFSALIGCRVNSMPLQEVTEAVQSIEFALDEKGVKLHSEAKMSFGCSASISVVPRNIILEPPFLLMMKRHDAPVPYFVAWIGNADHLRKP